MTVYWAPLLHIYQPPTQDARILKQINEECYKPLFNVFEEQDKTQFCLNINGILIDLLYEHQLEDTLYQLKKLVAEKKIEILGTAKYHPILPLIPKKEAQHQIIINENINRKEFGNWVRNGFFPPELSIDSKVAKFIRELGYKWVILSGIACPTDWPYDKIYSSPNGLHLYFRDDILSNKISFNKISPKDFIHFLKNMFKEKTKKTENKYVVTALDGETFGFHIKNYERSFLAKVMELINKEDTLEIISISNLEKIFPVSNQKIIPKDSSWSTSSDDMKAGIYYPLWKHPDNTIHKYYWKIIDSLNNLIDLTEGLDLKQNWDIENYYNTARWFYDRGLHSCPAWWANPQRGSWSPNLIYKGVELLIKAAINAQMALIYAGNHKGEGYFDSVSYYHGLLLMELINITKIVLKSNLY